MSGHLLSFILFLPLLFGFIVLILPDTYQKSYKYLTLLSGLLQLALSGWMFINFKSWVEFDHGRWSVNQFRFVEQFQWIDLHLGSLGTISIEYFLGVDGLNCSMILLSAIVIVAAAVASWNIEKSRKGYFALFLLLSCTIPGCFAALDFFLFYLFFELMLLPMYFLIGIWGGPRREYASIKFFLYTLFGSLFILIVIIALNISVIDPVKTAVNAGYATKPVLVGTLQEDQVQYALAHHQLDGSKVVHTFNLLAMTDRDNYIPGSLLHPNHQGLIMGIPVRYLCFLALLIGFAIKLPAFPFHTWLPDAHVEAPTPVSVLLAGILLKIGGYGILRCAYAIFPEGAFHYSWYIGFVGVISIIYGGLNALAMSDLKKMIAYSSVSHMGFVLLGIASLTAEGINGSVFQMFSHGILSSLLFLLTGVLYDRTHDRTIDFYRGLAIKMPAYATLVTVAFFASLGLPGFSGFIGELFVLLGAFDSSNVNGALPRWMAIAGSIGILIGAAYFLWTLQKMFFGKFSISQHLGNHFDLQDLIWRERLVLVPLVLLTIALGIFPGILFDRISQPLSDFTNYLIASGSALK